MTPQRLIQTTLGLEIAVIVFAACAAFGLRLAPPRVIVAVAGGVIVLAIAALAFSRGRVGTVLGSLIPIALLVGGFVIPLPDLLILGVVFAALWIGGLVLARRLAA